VPCITVRTSCSCQLFKLKSAFTAHDYPLFFDRYAFERSECAAGAESAKNNGGYGFDFLYFINVSNALFLKAEAEGLATR